MCFRLFFAIFLLIVLFRLENVFCFFFNHENNESNENFKKYCVQFKLFSLPQDNAYDPDVKAKQFWIDKTVVNGQECLSFMDNGNGLTFETMYKMLR